MERLNYTKRLRSTDCLTDTENRTYTDRLADIERQTDTKCLADGSKDFGIDTENLSGKDQTV